MRRPVVALFAAKGAVLPVALLLALLLALVLRLGYLDAGLIDDDFVQQSMLRGDFPIERSALELYWFAGRDEAEARALVEQGYHPWWTHPEHRVAMFRPLSSALIALEHQLSLSAATRHAISLGWLLLTVLAGFLLLRELLPAGVAGLAIVLFAVDESLAAPSGWLANRSTLVATAFGFGAAALHVHAHRLGRQRVSLAAVALALFGVLGGEYGFLPLGYVLAYEAKAWLDTSARAERRACVLRLVPYALLFGLHAAVSKALGYGVRYSGFYVSPTEDPGRYLIELLQRVPALVTDIVLGIPAYYASSGVPLRDFALQNGWLDARQWHALPEWRHVVIGLGALLVALIAVLAPRLWRSRRELLGLPVLLAGALLSLLPGASALPGARLAVAAELGAAALLASLALFVLSRVRTEKTFGPRALAAMLGVLVLLVHGALSAQRTYLEADAFGQRAHAAERWALAADIPETGTEALDVWLVAASDFTTAAHVPFVRLSHGEPAPRSFRLLSGARLPHDVVRLDDRTLELQVLSSETRGGFAGSLYRPERTRFRTGEVFELPRMTVEIVATRGGHPYRMRFRADRSLDDPSIVLLCVEPSGIKRCEPPPIGFVMRLPRAPVPTGDPRAPFERALRPF